MYERDIYVTFVAHFCGREKCVVIHSKYIHVSTHSKRGHMVDWTYVRP